MERYPFKTKPYQHQYDVWLKSRDKEEFALLLDMGTGKSKVLIDTIAYLYDNGKINGALIIAPKGVYRNWTTIEIPRHMPDHVSYYMTYWSSYNTKQQVKLYNPLFKVSDKLHILVMNVEALSTQNGQTFARKFLSTHTTILAIDESTTIKNPKAKRTKAAISLGNLAKYRRIMSGMPVTRSPLDLYSQCVFLDWYLLGFSSFFAFRNRYALVQKMQMGNRVFDKVVGYQRLEELTEKIAPFSSRVTKEECLDLPPKVYVYRDVDLTPEQERYYAQMKDTALVQLENMAFVTAPMVMTKMQKLHEIICGFIRDPETGGVTEIPSNRISAVMDILEETDRKVIIWSNNTYDMSKLKEAISKEYGPDSVATYYGSTSDNDRELIRQNFQDPEHPLRFFISNPATGKFGMTLTEAKVVIYYSNDYNLENRVQSEDRAHRIGQVDKVLYVDLITRGTVDEKIIESLRNKKKISDMVMGEDYKQWLE
jgi:SNF2 family DNA or RNA helicase